MVVYLAQANIKRKAKPFEMQHSTREGGLAIFMGI